MDTTKRSNLDNLIPLWEREVANRVHKSVAESFIREDVNLPNPAGAQEGIGQGSTLAQDVFSALVLRQRGFKRGI